ncbi:MAG: VOC family protein [Hyphomicrobiaceae bacterium]|nr:VOC family protein [Hyphomicrobiaceae bacterium]MCC0024130.1 VOC family protein [Hyphomicrobiaceae bacterium]
MSFLCTYLHFDGESKDAMSFYHSVLGGDLTMNTFAEFGMAGSPNDADKIMHAQLKVSDRILFMAADAPDHVEPSEGRAFSMSIAGDAAEDETMRSWFAGILDGGTVTQPLEAAPWGDVFGMGIDKFGVRWMFNIMGTANS